MASGSPVTITRWPPLGRLFVMTELWLRVLVLLGLSALGFMGGFGAGWLVR